MESIIKKLYFLVLEHSTEKSKTSKARDRAYAAYDKIEKALSEKQRTLLDDFVKKSENFHADEEREMYYRGFKTGILLMSEVFDADQIL